MNQGIKSGVFTVTDVPTVLPDTFQVQAPHEELLTYQGKDAEAKESQDQHVNKLLHGAQQGPHNDLQTWEGDRCGEEPPQTEARGRHRREQPQPQTLFDYRLELETAQGDLGF